MGAGVLAHARRLCRGVAIPELRLRSTRPRWAGSDAFSWRCDTPVRGTMYAHATG